jgi:CCR4-NOT transcription complex subunit 7/8
MTSLCDGHFGGLQRLADDLTCPRIGPEHQAGSDSLLTMVTYFALARAKFAIGGGGGNGGVGAIDDAKYRNELFGYGNNHTVRKGPVGSHGHSNSAMSGMSGIADC